MKHLFRHLALLPLVAVASAGTGAFTQVSSGTSFYDNSAPPEPTGYNASYYDVSQPGTFHVSWVEDSLPATNRVFIQLGGDAVYGTDYYILSAGNANATNQYVYAGDQGMGGITFWFDPHNGATVGSGFDTSFRIVPLAHSTYKGDRHVTLSLVPNQLWVNWTGATTLPTYTVLDHLSSGQTDTTVPIITLTPGGTTSVTEGNTFAFGISRSGNRVPSVTISIHYAGLALVNGVDFFDANAGPGTALPTSVTFLTNETAKSFTLRLRDDQVFHRTRALQISLSGSGVSFQGSTDQLTVLDNDPMPEPRAYFKCNEGTGTFSADATGLGHDLALVADSGVPLPGWTGGYSINGILFRNIGHSFARSNPTYQSDFDVWVGESMTVMAWIKLAGITNGVNDQILAKGDDTPTSAIYNYIFEVVGTGTNTGRLLLAYKDGDGYTTSFSSAPGTIVATTPNQWIHVAARLTMASASGPSTGKLYINGAPVATTVSGAPQNAGARNSSPLTIGGLSNVKDASAFNGVIDEVRFYKRLVTDQEVADQFAIPPSSLN